MKEFISPTVTLPHLTARIDIQYLLGLSFSVETAVDDGWILNRQLLTILVKIKMFLFCLHSHFNTVVRLRQKKVILFSSAPKYWENAFCRGVSGTQGRRTKNSSTYSLKHFQEYFRPYHLHYSSQLIYHRHNNPSLHIYLWILGQDISNLMIKSVH